MLPGILCGKPSHSKISTLNPPQNDARQHIPRSRYFPLLAKRLGPALVDGQSRSGPRIADHRNELKPTTLFSQLPLLTVPGCAGFQVAQTIAIINYIGKIASTEGEAETASEFNVLLHGLLHACAR